MVATNLGRTSVCRCSSELYHLKQSIPRVINSNRTIPGSYRILWDCCEIMTSSVCSSYRQACSSIIHPSNGESINTFETSSVTLSAAKIDRLCTVSKRWLAGWLGEWREQELKSSTCARLRDRGAVCSCSKISLTPQSDGTIAR